ncbi:hypothetical protein V0U79_00180 [Hyphobacterium sp. HN65]|uniref:STAS/SEC14 domain-containing protein n=1 Tax=Hyphobacterium lacteum TaxID=3116575 RepID=A0ABU7LLG6_9PROT|nr:hypothetical protein [Hyphobacterium sp. HN65]MEE2524767.1 hypothetical protein [Hyphobacterium sp. HN65]
MPYTIRYLPEHNVFEMRTHGEMKIEEIAAYSPDCMSRPEWNEDCQILGIAGVEADFSGFTLEGYRTVLIPAMKAARSGKYADLKEAILVEKDLDVGIIKLFEMLATDVPSLNTRVFRSRNEALDWLTSDD